MTLPDARARVEQDRDDKLRIAEQHARNAKLAEMDGRSTDCSLEQAQELRWRLSAEALSLVLVELDRLPRLLEALEDNRWRQISALDADGAPIYDQECFACGVLRGEEHQDCWLTAALEDK